MYYEHRMRVFNQPIFQFRDDGGWKMDERKREMKQQLNSTR